MSKPKLYSYARFSSPEQEKGFSVRRQIEMAERYATEEGLLLDDELRLTDKGKSGFHGAHLAKGGALAAFLEFVKSGEVAPNSILLVENIDRLGRENVIDAIRTVVFDLIGRDIIIQTLDPRRRFSKASIDDDIYELIAEFKRAHRESKRKSQLSKDNWKRKRQNASKELLTARIPAWLKIVENEPVAIPEAAAAVVRIFELKLDGFGKNAIAKKLNETAAWKPPGRKGKPMMWRGSYVEKILRSPAVTGVFQPHRVEIEKDKDGTLRRVRIPDGDPVPNYFPVVVSTEVFQAAQRKAKSNKGEGGQTGEAHNVFKHLCRCGYCGGPVHLENKGDTSKGGKNLFCVYGRNGVVLEKTEDGKSITFKCAVHRVRYSDVEQAVLDNCSKLKPELVLPSVDEQAAQRKDALTRVQGLSHEIAGLDQQIKNYNDAIGETGSKEQRREYEERIEARKETKKIKQAALEEAQVNLHRLEKALNSFTEWQKNLLGLKKAIATSADCRTRLNTHLKQFISRIEIFADGHDDNVERCEEMIFPFDALQIESHPKFIRYLRQRLVSREGRFFKIYFKTQPSKPRIEPAKKLRKHTRQYSDMKKRLASVDEGLTVAPKESLAFRIDIEGTAMTFIGPKLDILANEFFDGRKSGQFVPKAKYL